MTIWQRNEDSKVAWGNEVGEELVFCVPHKGRRELSVLPGQPPPHQTSLTPNPAPERTHPPRVIHSPRKLPSPWNRI